MTRTATPDIELEEIRATYGPAAAARKKALLRGLGRRAFADAGALLRHHETLCFLRAYPDDAELLTAVEARLAAFGARADVRRLRRKLADSGVAGTDIHFPFFWFTARWLARHWPEALVVDWSEPIATAALEKLLPQLLPYAESLTVDQLSFTARDWLNELKGSDETDATFLIRRFAALPFGDFGREAAYDGLNPWLQLRGGPTTPSRTRARHAESRVSFQTHPLDLTRPDMVKEARRPPVGIRVATPGEAARLIGLARAAMVTRARDLDAFENANPRDIRVIDCGQGLEFVAVGQVPERRLLLESVYGFLTLKNGVPIGYVLVSALFGSAEIAYNIFETFRGGESARVFGRVLGMARALFGVDTFSIEPFQLGYGNDEGLRSGAWWFYYKVGFRPADAEVQRVLRDELARMKADPRRRTDLRTLKKLASAHMFLHLGRPRSDTLGQVALDNIGLRVTRRLAEYCGGRREAGLRRLAREAARRLGFGGLGRLAPAERLAFERWAPLIDLIPDVERWSTADRRAAVAALRAKGGRHESDFVRLFDAHSRLRRGILRLARAVD